MKPIVFKHSRLIVDSIDRHLNKDNVIEDIVLFFSRHLVDIICELALGSEHVQNMDTSSYANSLAKWVLGLIW